MLVQRHFFASCSPFLVSLRSGSGFGSSDPGSGGGLFSGLGGKPSAEKAGTNVFGTAQTFGSSQESSKFCLCDILL